jgi:hypothetical protein
MNDVTLYPLLGQAQTFLDSASHVRPSGLWLVGCVLLLAGCVNAPYKKPPSTAAAQEAVNSARGNVDSAQSENQAAQAENRSAMTHNRKARTISEQVDNKATVIEKWLDNK